MKYNLRSYLADRPKYEYKIKLAVDEVTDCMIDCIINALEKYEFEQASEFKGTPIEENPLDFPNVKNSPVYISEISLRYPSTSDMLQKIISDALGLSEQRVVVYTQNDPRQVETDLFIDRCLSDKDPVTRLGKDDYEGEGLEGEDYNEQKFSLLKELESNRKKTDRVDDGTLGSDYHSYDDTKEESSPGLFGRMMPKDKK